MLKFGTYSDISPDYDEIWVIMRSVKKLPTTKSDTIIKQVQELSPSVELLSYYLDMKRAGEWTEENFKFKYVPEFISNINNQQSLNALLELHEKAKDKNILVMCSCKNELMCHRSIVAGIMQGMFGDINIESNDPANYMSYYYDYKKATMKIDPNSSECTQVFEPHHLQLDDEFCLIVTGHFHYRDYIEFIQVMDFVLINQVRANKKITIVAGSQKGTDSMAKRYAEESNYTFMSLPVEWEKYGKKAGYKRSNKVKNFTSLYKKENRGLIIFRNTHDNALFYDGQMGKESGASIKVFDIGNHCFINR